MVSASLKYFKIITKRTINNKHTHARNEARIHTKHFQPIDISSARIVLLISSTNKLLFDVSPVCIEFELSRDVDVFHLVLFIVRQRTHAPGIFHFNHIFKLGLRMNACDCGGVKHVPRLGKHLNTLYRVNNCCQISFMNMDPLCYYPQ